MMMENKAEVGNRRFVGSSGLFTLVFSQVTQIKVQFV